MNDSNKILMPFNSSITFFNIAKNYENSDPQKAISLYRKAINKLYDDKPETFDDPYYLAKVNEIYPEIREYYSKLGYMYGKLKLYEYVQYCIFKILGVNRIEDNFYFKTIKIEEDGSQPYILKFIGLLNDLSNFDSESYLKVIDVNQSFDMPIPKNYGNFNIVTKDGNLVPAKNYFGTVEDEDGSLSMAEFYMTKNLFNEAISLLSKVNTKNYPKARAELAICYFLNNQTDLAISTTLNASSIDLVDKNNLLVFYYDIGDIENFELIKKELTTTLYKNPISYFKLGISMSQVREHELACKYLKKYLNFQTYDLKTRLLYAIACINAHFYEAAKKELIYLLDVDIFNELVYKDYLLICQEKPKRDLEYTFDVQLKRSFRYNKLIENLMQYDNQIFVQELLQNLSLIDWVARSSYCSNKRSFLLKVASIEEKHILTKLEDVLLDVNVEDEIKYLIIQTKLDLGIMFKQQICYVTNQTLHRIYFTYKNIEDVDNEKINYLNPKDCKKINPELYDALCMAQMYIVKYDGLNTKLGIMTPIFNYFNDFNGIHFNSIENIDYKYYLAAYFAYNSLQYFYKDGKKIETFFKQFNQDLFGDVKNGDFLTHILEYFHLDKQTFSKFTEEIKLKIYSKKENL